MKTRTLGPDLRVSAVGLGYMGMNQGYGPLPDRNDAIALIRATEVDLTIDELDEIETAASKIKIQGARYPEHLERLTGR
jgi:hypothetical protein